MKAILPRVFIASSSEGKKFALALKTNLKEDHKVTVWNQAFFTLGRATMEVLASMIDEYDFAIFVFSPDDELKLRGHNYLAARDNVYFECGLFMGRLGRERSFFVRPANHPALRIPSDLLGISCATYNHLRKDQNWVAGLAKAAKKIRTQIHTYWVSKGFELSRHLITELSKPQTGDKWLKRVMQSGYFCGIDEGFWLGYCERLHTNDRRLISEHAKMIAEARNTLKVKIRPDDAYVLMEVLFERVVKKTQHYYAIATKVDLNSSNSKNFIFDLPIKFPGNVWRLFMLPNRNVLRKLDPHLKQSLIMQLDQHIPLRVLEQIPGPRENFGIYGHLAVGTLDPRSKCNVVNFDPVEVTQRLDDFLALWKRAVELEPSML